MPEIFEIKSRIDGLKSIHNITYAMQIVTISRIKRITNQLQKLRESLVDAKRVLGRLLVEDEHIRTAFFNPELALALPPVFILCFSNRGFCGSFNQDVLNQFTAWCHSQNIPEDSVELLCVGKKAIFVTKKRKARFFAPQKDLFTQEENLELYKIVDQYIKEGRRIYTVQFEFKSIISQRLTIEQFYPPREDAFAPYITLSAPVYVEPAFKTAQTNMAAFYYRLKLLKVIQDSISSEFSQRFLLMKSAVDNVKSLSDELNMNLNKERQRMITQEISEIISTFKALKKQK
ncbi:MAG: F0F1 ATP synthase subunit gamma [Candidatus Margulisbacteria bacterium]|nr:F0F1 ATP synthase subunit gamma [Candidatus Margulisiibacteriota bacterium]